MQLKSTIIPLQAINDSVTKEYGINLLVLRTDLNHPTISGNKWFKLKYNLQEAKQQNIKTVLTFGGAFSNHIAATAAAAKEYDFNSIGIIRGEEYPELNPTLKFATECGMKLHYVSRTLYHDKEALNKYVNEINSGEDFYLIPEGGSNELGIKGCKEITLSIPIDFDYICTACGTGATMAGVILSLKNEQKAIGFQVLKGENYIKKEVSNWLNKFTNSNEQKNNWGINEDYHLGGYAKINQELKDFIKQFEHINNIPLDIIYTGKMMYGIYDMIKKGKFKKGETIVAIHTGGLQGNISLMEKQIGNKNSSNYPR